MNGLAIALAILLLGDALRLRARARRLAVLPTGPPPVPDAPTGPETGSLPSGPGEETWVTAEGVAPGTALRAAAAAHAAREGLAVLDLWPPDLPAGQAMGLLQLVDPGRWRSRPFHRGVTAGVAIRVAPEVARRAHPPRHPAHEVAFLRLAHDLRRHAPAATDVAVAPALAGVGPRGTPWRRRRAVMGAATGLPGSLVVALQLLPLALIPILGVAAGPAAGWTLLAAWHLQVPLALLGTPLRPPDLVSATLLRLPRELVAILGAARGGWSPPEDRERREHLRADFARALAGGAPSFGPPRAACPVCGHPEAEPLHELPDRFQHKPGRFRLVRCTGCRAAYQDPPLDADGLAFVYAEFYDGLGGERIEQLFDLSLPAYRARARMVAEHAHPRRWLDVGAGHGHFCLVARETFPDCAFEGIDRGPAARAAVRWGRLDALVEGLLVERAEEIAGRYDVVSMSHVLEHTPDPLAELRAARRVLREGGFLLIEVPDPTTPMARLLGGWWMPWFQPQHLVLPTPDNLAHLLRAAGFRPLAWERGAAHQPVEIALATWMALDALAPPPDLPWAPPAGRLARLRRLVVWTPGSALLLAAIGADLLLAPLQRLLGWSNTVRVVARVEDRQARPRPPAAAYSS